METNECKKLHIGSKLFKEDGTIVMIEKYGLAGNETVYGLSDGTMIFREDVGVRMKLFED